MDLKLLKFDKKQNLGVFEISKSNVVFVNTLRRIIVEEVPTMAIEDVEIIKNSSVLYDEMLSHRLGLIPLTTDLTAYNEIAKCDCNGEGCAKCSLKLTLQSKGESLVVSGDMISKDSKVKPAFDKIQIAKLLQDQEIELIATAVLGVGKDHAKWVPGLVHYHLKPTLKIINHDKKCVENSPEGVFQFKSEKLVLNDDYAVDLTVLDACVENNPDCLQLNLQEDTFIFYIESWGQLTPTDIMAKAIEVVKEKLVDFSEQLNSL